MPRQHGGASVVLMGPRAGTSGAALTAVLLLATACGGNDEEAPQMQVEQTIAVTSTAFTEGERIPVMYTCDGADTSPPLSWQGLPAEAAAVALVVDDPDAPNGTFTHWVVLDVEPDVAGNVAGGVPAGGVQAQNSAGRASYFGPCPPGGTHHYRFTVYGLSEPTGLADGVSLSDALAAIEARAVAWGRLTGTYARR